jgi:hypothetical protein
MCDVSVSTELEAPVDTVWETIRDFKAINRYATGITQCKMEGDGIGSIRKLTVASGEILERLESLDDQAKEITYSLIKSPLPIESCQSTMSLSYVDEGKCSIKWSSSFEPDGVPEKEAIRVLSAVYKSGIEGLKRLLCQ